jgi:hypothetical protein
MNLPEPEDVEAWQIQSLQQLVLSIPTVSDLNLDTGTVADFVKKRPLADASSRNSLARFDTVIQKKYPEILDGFNEDVFRGEDRGEVRELFGFIDDVYVPLLLLLSILTLSRESMGPVLIVLAVKNEMQKQLQRLDLVDRKEDVPVVVYLEIGQKLLPRLQSPRCRP